jgi:hypothetical protein
MTLLATVHSLKNDKGKHKNGKLEFEVYYLICVSRIGSHHVALFVGATLPMGKKPHPLLVVAFFTHRRTVLVVLALLTCGTGPCWW